jgi:hypothetical protein
MKSIGGSILFAPYRLLGQQAPVCCAFTRLLTTKFADNSKEIF